MITSPDIIEQEVDKILDFLEKACDRFKVDKHLPPPPKKEDDGKERDNEGLY